jgi:hypothetical protein
MKLNGLKVAEDGAIRASVDLDDNEMTEIIMGGDVDGAELSRKIRSFAGIAENPAGTIETIDRYEGCPREIADILRGGERLPVGWAWDDDVSVAVEVALMDYRPRLGARSFLVALDDSAEAFEVFQNFSVTDPREKKPNPVEYIGEICEFWNDGKRAVASRGFLTHIRHGKNRPFANSDNGAIYHSFSPREDPNLTFNPEDAQ